MTGVWSGEVSSNGSAFDEPTVAGEGGQACVGDRGRRTAPSRGGLRNAKVAAIPPVVDLTPDSDDPSSQVAKDVIGELDWPPVALWGGATA
jgi:hypothetical protein